MPQFCILFYADYTILATQRGGAWPDGPSLNTTLRAVIHPKYNLINLLYCRALFVLNHEEIYTNLQDISIHTTHK